MLVWAADRLWPGRRLNVNNRPAVNQQEGAPVTTYYRKATIDGLEIFYREAGEPAKPAFLLLHGFPASSFMFRSLLSCSPTSST